MRRRGRYRGLMLALGLCLAVPAWASPGVMLRDDEMRSGASATSSPVERVAKGAAVEIVGRHGGWIRIQSAGKTGWVRLLSVRGGVSEQTNALEEAKGVLGLGQRQSEPNKVVATAGLRGLNEEDLKTAHFDPGQLQKLDGWAVSEDEARRFADEAGLAHRSVAYLPAPDTDHKGSSPSGGFIW
jgi:SH3-like domain-containing protein